MKKISKEYDLIFISPHLDDAILSCGGLICKSIDDNKRVLIVTIFNRSDDKNHLLFKKRNEENKNAVKVLGCELTNLNFMSGEFRYKNGNYNSQLNKDISTEQFIISRITKKLSDLIIRKLKLNGKIFFPAAVGGHIDHKIVKKIGENIKSSDNVWFWEDYPYNLYLKSKNSLFKDNLILDKVVDVWDYIELKRKGIECYVSQLELLFKRKPMFLSARENYYKITAKKKRNKNNIIYLTDELSGGARIANDYILREITQLIGTDHFKIYEQIPPLYNGYFVGTKIIFWSTLNFLYFIKNCTNVSCVITTSPNAVMACYFLKKIKFLNAELIYYINGDRSFYSPLIKKTKGLFKYSYHMFYCFLYKKMEQLVCGTIDKVVVPSAEFKKIIFNKYNKKISETKIFVIKHGVDKKLFFQVTDNVKREMRRVLKIEENAKIIMYSGRIDPLKGIDLLIDSLKVLRSKENIILLLISPPPDECMMGFYKNVLLKIKNSIFDIRLIHPCDKFEVADYYKISDFVMLPSAFESSSLVMYEAITSGCIFTGYCVGEITYILNLINKNLLMNSLDVETTTKKINWLLSLSNDKKNKIINDGKNLISIATWFNTGKELVSLINKEI